MQIELPQGRFITNAEPANPVILVAGGRPPAEIWLTTIAHNYPVWAIDRGIDACRSASVVPELLIGDADSGAAESWRWAEALQVPAIRHPVDKDLTDLQLTLQELGSRRPDAQALLTGGMGRRFDHAHSNLFSLLEASSWGVQAIGLADESEAIFFLEGGQSFQAELLELPIAVSLLPMSAVCENVKSRGVHWPLHGATLTMNHPGAICNRLAAGSRRVDVSLGSGRMGVYFCWSENNL